MRPKNQNRRLLLIAVSGAVLAIGTWLVFSALQKSTQFFYNPSEVLAENFVPKSAEVKIGGLVILGSVQKDNGIKTTFSISDFPVEGETPSENTEVLRVQYSGVLPDLFAEGDGVVVSGLLLERDFLHADDVLAKHDENYQPVKK